MSDRYSDLILDLQSLSCLFALFSNLSPIRIFKVLTQPKTVKIGKKIEFRCSKLS